MAGLGGNEADLQGDSVQSFTCQFKFNERVTDNVTSSLFLSPLSVQ